MARLAVESSSTISLPLYAYPLVSSNPLDKIMMMKCDALIIIIIFSKESLRGHSQVPLPTWCWKWVTSTSRSVGRTWLERAVLRYESSENEIRERGLPSHSQRGPRETICVGGSRNSQRYMVLQHLLRHICLSGYIVSSIGRWRPIVELVQIVITLKERTREIKGGEYGISF